MLDPISAIAAAKLAYETIKKGFQIGKDVESMAGDIGRWMNAINDVKESHNKAKSRRFGSVEEEALETFAAKKQAEKMEEELRNFIIGNYGLNGWNDIIRIQGQLRKKRAEEKRLRQQKIDDIIYWGSVASLILLISVFVISILTFSLV